MKTTPIHLLQNLKKYPNELAISFKDHQGTWQNKSWKEFYDFSEAIAKALIANGIQKDDKISIYSYNRIEWNASYIASQMINSVAVGVYHTSSSQEVEWVVGNSESKIVFVGNNPNDNDEEKKMPVYRLQKILDRLEKVDLVVLLDGVPKIKDEKVISWDEFLQSGESVKVEKISTLIENIKLDDTSSLIYTSGTTGNPKGVELTHKNWSFLMEILSLPLKFHQGDRTISWLPGAHVFGQALDNHYWVRRTMHSFIVDSPLNTVDIAKEVKPHLFCSVPRIYEKVYSNFIAAIESKPILKLGLSIPVISNIFKKKLKEAAGFGELKFAISGAAPINPDILTLFQKIGIPLFEGYGMTENTAGATLNFHGNNKIGTVGKALPNTAIKIAEDGEVLIRGDHVMKGYYNNQKATSETIIDGWLQTGDVGIIDSDGFLSITGRKKEIYVSSAGKNIAPLVIEETVKSIPIVSQCFLVGDAKKYCSALITLDVGAILRDKIGIENTAIPKDPTQQLNMLVDNGHQLSDFTNSEELKSDLQKEINIINNRFSDPEQIKKFSVLSRDFTIDDGELTPTLKIRRKQINSNWSETIDSLYEA